MEARVPLLTDAEGYVSRLCPSCGARFRVQGDSVPDSVLLMFCVCCGHQGDREDFATPEQIEYAKSLIHHELTKQFEQTIRKAFRGSKNITLTSRGSLPIVRTYQEKALETPITCDGCKASYDIYGVFAYCPVCGEHNSLQTLKGNLAVIGKMLSHAATGDEDVQKKAVESALGDVVSAFDGFGRHVCERHRAKMSFQSIVDARTKFMSKFGTDFAAGLSATEWAAVVRGFNKRHLIAHTAGVIDQKYIDNTGDTSAVVGRRVTVSASEVEELAEMIGRLGAAVQAGAK
jgi:Zn ribbon nucleic-acid-binding protein